MRFTIRDVLWLMIVVAVAVGWWLDQERIRREWAALLDERKMFQATVQRLKSLPLRSAEAALNVAEAEFISLMEIRQHKPDAIPESELRRVESKVHAARLDVEKARLKSISRRRRTS